MTTGEKRVRVQFNPSQKGNVQRAKEKIAEIIDVLDEFKNDDTNNHDSEAHRLIAIAQTSLEEAAMWTVKALTSGT